MTFPDTLDRLIEEGVIDGVRGRLMSGKEAAVFVVERQGELLAAKVYKAREQRTFKATASYTEGRSQSRNSRDRRAMGKRTSYGRELMEESWRDVEVRALSEAFHAGVRVPRPFMLHDDVLLMELLVDEEGAPAPRLADFDLPREAAEPLHREIFDQVRRLLSCGRIHGDLSAFNVLMARGGPTLIDMPQVVDAARNNQAREILRRDLRNITEHLARYDARLLRFRDCGDALWLHYMRGTLDAATAPQEGGVSDGHHGGRRVRDAERGRMGRERPAGGAARYDADPRHGRSEPPAPTPGPGPGPRRDGPPRLAGAGQGPPRHGRDAEAPHRSGPPRPQHGPPRAEHGPRRTEHGPPRTEHGPPRAEHGPPRADHGPQRADHGPPRADHGPQRADHGPPRAEHRPQRTDHGPQRAEHGPQRAEHRPQRADHGPQRAEHRPQRADHGPQRAEHGPQRADHGPQRTEHGPQRAEHGPQRADHGPQRAEHGPQRAEHGPPRAEHGPRRTEYGPPRAEPRPPRAGGAGPRPPRQETTERTRAGGPPASGAAPPGDSAPDPNRGPGGERPQ